MPAPGPPSSVSRTWVEITCAIFPGRPDVCERREAATGLSLSLLLRQPLRPDAVLAGDLGLVRPYEAAVADDLLAADVESVDAVRRRQHQPRNRVDLGAPQLEPVGAPHCHVGTLSGRELPDVFAAEHRRSAASSQPQRLAYRHRL